MAKLKPLSKDEELSAIPVDEPVLVELEPPPSGEEPDEPEKPAKTRTPKADDGDDAGVKTLQQQLADMQRARDADAVRTAKELADARREAEEARQSVAETEADLVSSGLQAAQQQRDAAKLAVKAAFEAGDADKLADAQEQLGRAAADIREFERAAAVQSQREKAPPVQERQPVAPDFNATLNAMNLMPAERDWFTKHQDALIDPRQRTRLDAAYYDAMDEKLVRGSPEYFEFVDQRLGYKKPEQREDQEERTPIVSAPVSRDSRSASTGKVNGNPNQVTLSPQEREMARNMGISDIAYAKGKQQLSAAKSADPEKFYTR